MYAKIFVKIGPFYEKIAELKCIDMHSVIKEWKYASLIEFYDDNDNLIYIYEYS